MVRSLGYVLLAWWVVGLGAAALAQQPKAVEDPSDPRHDELRALRAAVVKAVNEQNIDALLPHLHPNVVIVWQNAEISRKHQGVRDYYQKTLGGPDSILKSFSVEPTVDELTIFYGDNTGISYGKAVSKFKFRDGDTFDLNGPWSATLVKTDGRWQIAEFHASAGLFDNPLLEAAKNALYIGVAVAGGVGVLLGAMIVLIVKRRQAASAL